MNKRCVPARMGSSAWNGQRLVSFAPYAESCADRRAVVSMLQLALHRMVLVVGFLLFAATINAQEPQAGAESPPPVPEIASQGDELPPTDLDESQAWITSAGQLGSAQTARYGAMSDWDLFAGKIYATTSPLWFHAEGLVWWMKGNRLPALVTTSPIGTPPTDAGVLGAPNTSILFGDERVGDGARGGFRTSLGVRLGHWFDHWMNTELEFGLLWVTDGRSSDNYYAVSSGDPILARPYDDLELNTPNAQLLAYPGIAQGDIWIETSGDFLSAVALARRAWGHTKTARFDWVAGYRYARLREELYLEERLTTAGAGGATYDLYDDFRTWNEFHGADMGVQLWTNVHGWSIEVLGKIAMGAVIRRVDVDGETLMFPLAGGSSRAPGGLLSMPSNIGRHTSNKFSVLPELTVRLRHPISRYFTVSVGYSILALDNVVRVGDQVDLAVNPTQAGNGNLVGAARPAMPMKDSLFWVHGFTLGLEW